MRPATFLMKKKVRSTIQSPTSDLLFLHNIEYFLSEIKYKKNLWTCKRSCTGYFYREVTR